MNKNSITLIAHSLLWFNLFICASPLLHVHVHHQARGPVEVSMPSSRHDGNKCDAHRMHACEAETLFEHIYEHGAMLEESSSSRFEGPPLADLPACIIVHEFEIQESIRPVAPNDRVPSRADGRIPALFNPRSPPRSV